MDLNLLVILFLHGIPQKGRVSPNVILTSSLQMEILSTVSERKVLNADQASWGEESILSLINLSDVCP